MQKLDMQSKDRVQDNIQKIRTLFPSAVKEVKRGGKVSLAVDFDVLRQEMSSSLIEGNEERYQFTWPDKRKAILLANTPINATLRPAVEESENFDTTQNLYIEGDNLEVLKLLQETYLGGGWILSILTRHITRGRTLFTRTILRRTQNNTKPAADNMMKKAIALFKI